jgi:hypothetical protein
MTVSAILFTHMLHMWKMIFKILSPDSESYSRLALVSFSHRGSGASWSPSRPGIWIAFLMQSIPSATSIHQLAL